MADEQVSLTSLILIIVLGGLIIRYLFFSPASQPPRTTRDAQSASRAREAAVERIQQMFPQVDRRTILWDLHRNGGNIAATTERILSGRLETVGHPNCLPYVTSLLAQTCVSACDANFIILSAPSHIPTTASPSLPNSFVKRTSTTAQGAA